MYNYTLKAVFHFNRIVAKRIVAKRIVAKHIVAKRTVFHCFVSAQAELMIWAQ